MTRLTRPALGAVIGVVLVLIVAAPVAAAAPTKTVIHPTDDSYDAQDSGCGFPVTRVFSAGARTTFFDYSDGSEMLVAHNDKLITNLDNNKTFTQHTAVRRIVWFDAVAGVWRGQSSGQFIFAFYPGDIGPDGQPVEAPGLGLTFTGSARYAWDQSGEHIAEFSYRGSYVDICAALS